MALKESSIDKPALFYWTVSCLWCNARGIIRLCEKGRTTSYKTALKILSPDWPCSHRKNNFVMDRTPLSVLFEEGYISPEEETDDEEVELK